jgi:hypothetical protein
MPHLSPAEIQQFQTCGFVLVRGVYEPSALLGARQRLMQAIEQGHENATGLINDLYRVLPEMAQVVFNEKYIAVIQELIGPEAVLIPECAAHHNRYIHWHKDTTEQELAGLTSHHDLSTPILQAATYFQENSGGDGGGLTLIPGTHRRPDRFRQMYSKNWALRFSSLRRWNLGARKRAQTRCSCSTPCSAVRRWACGNWI